MICLEEDSTVDTRENASFCAVGSSSLSITRAGFWGRVLPGAGPCSARKAGETSSIYDGVKINTRAIKTKANIVLRSIDIRTLAQGQLRQS